MLSSFGCQRYRFLEEVSLSDKTGHLGLLKFQILESKVIALKTQLPHPSINIELPVVASHPKLKRLCAHSVKPNTSCVLLEMSSHFSGLWFPLK